MSQNLLSSMRTPEIGEENSPSIWPTRPPHSENLQDMPREAESTSGNDERTDTRKSPIIWPVYDEEGNFVPVRKIQQAQRDQEQEPGRQNEDPVLASRKQWNAVRESFTGEDPLAFIEDKGERFILNYRLGRMKNPDEERKKWALAQYYALRLGRQYDIRYLHDAMDEIIAHFHDGKKVSVDKETFRSRLFSPVAPPEQKKGR